MVISQCKKADFSPFSKVADGVFNVCWGQKSIMERVTEVVDGEVVFTGEVKESSLCSYVIERVYSNSPSINSLSRLFDKSQRAASAAEIKAIGEALGEGDEKLIPVMKKNLTRSITEYDSSSDVNSFTIGGVEVWLDKSTRTGLLLRFQSEQAQGKTETTLWYNGMSFPLAVESAIQMLYAIELYASACYDNTQSLLAELDALESVDELLLFDYKRGYPEKLVF